MVSYFSEIIIENGHKFDSEHTPPCGCWGLCHCGAKQCLRCYWIFSYSSFPSDFKCEVKDDEADG